MRRWMASGNRQLGRLFTHGNYQNSAFSGYCGASWRRHQANICIGSSTKNLALRRRWLVDPFFYEKRVVLHPIPNLWLVRWGFSLKQKSGSAQLASFLWPAMLLTDLNLNLKIFSLHQPPPCPTHEEVVLFLQARLSGIGLHPSWLIQDSFLAALHEFFARQDSRWLARNITSRQLHKL